MARTFAFVSTIVMMLLIAATTTVSAQNSQNCRLPSMFNVFSQARTEVGAVVSTVRSYLRPCSDRQYYWAYIDPTKNTLTSVAATTPLVTVPNFLGYHVATILYTTIDSKIIDVVPGPIMAFPGVSTGPAKPGAAPEYKAVKADYATLANRFKQKFGITVVVADSSDSIDTFNDNAAGSSWPIASVAACACFAVLFAAGIVTYRRRARATYTTLLGETTEQGYQTL